MARERIDGQDAPKDSINHQEIPVHVIKGFSKADGYVVSDDSVLEAELKRLGLFNEEFGYRAFNPKRFDFVLANGTDRTDDRLNLCLTTSEAKKKQSGVCIDDGGAMTLLEYMDEYRKGRKEAMFIVYDFSQIEGSPEWGDANCPNIPEFKFIDSKNKKAAVKAVIVAEDFGAPLEIDR